ncbi:MAG: hypothetical protein V5A27_01235 [Halapricum sp.]
MARNWARSRQRSRDCPGTPRDACPVRIYRNVYLTAIKSSGTAMLGVTDA